MTLEQLTQWATTAPAGTLIPAETVADALQKAAEGDHAGRSVATDPEPATWRDRLWSCHGDVRIGVAELAEALDRAESWVYRHTSSKSGVSLLPHRKLDGQIVFVVGEVRGWIERNEVTVVAGRSPLQLTKRSKTQLTA